MALDSTGSVALLRPFAQPNGRHRIEDANASNVEEHVDGHIVIDTDVHYHKVVEEVTIGGKEVVDGPEPHALIHYEFGGEPHVLVDA